ERSYYSRNAPFPDRPIFWVRLKPDNEIAKGVPAALVLCISQTCPEDSKLFNLADRGMNAPPAVTSYSNQPLLNAGKVDSRPQPMLKGVGGPPASGNAPRII